MHFKLVFFVLFFVFFIRSSNAQKNENSISGFVFSKETLKSLNGATVMIENFTTNKIYRELTNSNGDFAYKNLPLGTYVLKVNFVGYRSSSDTLVLSTESLKPTFIKIALLPVREELKDVIIQGEKKEPFITFSKGKLILDVANSPLAVGNSAYTVLMRTPGLSEQNERLTFRSKTVNVLINGRPSNLRGEALRMFLEAMPANQLAKIEAIPNPSAKYDSDGGSVINIVLKVNNKYGISGTLTGALGTGRFFRQEEGITLNYGSEKLNFYSSYNLNINKQYYSTDRTTFYQPDTKIVTDDYETRRRNIQNLRVGLDYEVNNSLTIGLQGRGFLNNGLRQVESVVDAYSGLDKTASALTNTQSDVTIFSPYFNAYAEIKLDSLGKKLAINADVLNQDKSWNDVIVVDDTYGNAANQFLKATQPAAIFTHVYAVDYTQPLVIGKIEMGIKAQFTNTTNNPVWQRLIMDSYEVDKDRSYNFNYKENILAGYINWNTTFLQKVDLNLGLRVEQMKLNSHLITSDLRSKRNSQNLFPTIGVEYALSANSVLNANYRKSIDRFGFNVVNPFKNFINPYFSTSGNLDILPQIKHDMEFAYTYKQAFNFGVSYTQTKNVIAPVYLQNDFDNGIYSTYNNLPKAELFYLYANVPYKIAKWWSFNLSGGFGFYKFNTAVDTQITINKTWSYLTQLDNYFEFKNNWKFELIYKSRGPYASGIYKEKGFNIINIGVRKGFSDNKYVISANLTDLLNSNVTRRTTDYLGMVITAREKVESRYATLGFTWNFGSKKKKSSKNKAKNFDDLEKRI
ncbi:outer membrane beta-barrel protein [Pedobacter sp. MW01-1-1]|uniref:outer membrane beta-barrel protein n=1 Tax=Pedobacter sp. MW01-1-1 TaxID=3383027 RepID=UPI003FEE17EC